jgi:hypothetical protein
MDTSAWAALKNVKDGLHKKAQELNKQLLNSNYSYVTTNFVLDESYTLLLRKAGHYVAVELGEEIRKSKIVEVVHISEDIEERAWLSFKKYSDKSFSFTDCTSFVVMKELKIKECFTDDIHFQQVGFKKLLN